MRTRGSLVAALAGIALVWAGVTGCSGPPSAPVASPTPTKTPHEPTFASLEEAFQAAVATYQRYVDLSNLIGAEGGANPDRILEVVQEGDWANDELGAFRELEEHGARAEGAGTFRSPRLMQYVDSAALVQLYACAQYSNLRVINNEGADITPADRPDEVPYMVTFSIGKTGSLKISKSAVWDNVGIC